MKHSKYVKTDFLIPSCKLSIVLRSSFLQGLVVELVQSGDIKARTKWKEVYHLFRHDDRYLSMLGNPGSNPLELFWDAVDALDQKLDAKIVVVEDAIKRFNAKHHPAESEEPSDDKMKTDDETVFTITAETTWDEFVNVIREDGEAVRDLSQEDLQLVFKTVRVFCLHCLFLRLDSIVISFEIWQSRNNLMRKGGQRGNSVICKTIYVTR